MGRNFVIAEDIKTREEAKLGEGAVVYPIGYDSSDNMFITMSEQWNAHIPAMMKMEEELFCLIMMFQKKW